MEEGPKFEIETRQDQAHRTTMRKSMNKARANAQQQRPQEHCKATKERTGPGERHCKQPQVCVEREETHEQEHERTHEHESDVQDNKDQEAHKPNL